MRMKLVWTISLVLAAAALMCQPPSKPPDPTASAGIDADRSLTLLDSLGDSLEAGRTYACSVYIDKPSFIDSMVVSLRRGGVDTVVFVDTIGRADSMEVFPLRILTSGTYTLSVVLVKWNGDRDSLALTLSVEGTSDPADFAGVDSVRTLRLFAGLHDSLRVDRTYACTLFVNLPEFVDSCKVLVDGSVLLAAPVALDATVMFPLHIPTVGTRTITYVAFRSNLTADSVIRTLTVYEPVVPRITSIRPTVGAFTVGSSFACSVSVSLPAEADSFYARVAYGASDTLVARGAVTASPVVFQAPVVVVGGFNVKVRLKRDEGTWDSAQTSYTGLAVGTPSVTPDSAVYHVYLGDSVTVTFRVTDPDSNLWQCSTWVSDHPSLWDTDEFTPLQKKSGATTARTFHADSLGVGGHNVFAQAADFDAQQSAIVACSLVVVDTIRPVIQILPPFDNAAHVITSLPVTLRALITDDSPIDTVRLNASAMAMSGDTAQAEISTLPTGASTDTIVAWDRGGISDTVIVTLNYTGPVTYPPQVRPMSRTVAEGTTIDTIWLDSCVTLTLPSTQVPDPVAYKRDSLQWQVAGESGLFGLSFDSLAHRVFIALPDTELRVGNVVSEVITFRVTDSRGQSDQEFGAFVETGVNGVPVVTIADRWVYGDAPFDTMLLDTCFKDAEDSVLSVSQWEFTGGKVFMVQTLETCRSLCRPPLICVPLCFPDGRIAVVPDPTKIAPDSASKWRGTDSLYFRVRDNDSTWSAKKLVTFTRGSFIIFDPGIIVNPGPIQTFPKRAAAVLRKD